MEKTFEQFKLQDLPDRSYKLLLTHNPAIDGTKTGRQTMRIMDALARKAYRLALTELHTELMKNEYANSAVLAIIEAKLGRNG